MRDARQLKLSVAEANPLQTVQLEVQRNGSTKQLRVVLDEAPANDLLLNTQPSAAPQAPGA